MAATMLPAHLSPCVVEGASGLSRRSSVVQLDGEAARAALAASLRSMSSGALLLASAAATAAAACVSGPQGSVRPFTIINDPSAWRGADWAGREAEFKLQLSPGDVAALDAAIDAMDAAGRPLESLKRPSDFPLPAALSVRLAGMKRDLLHGRGFAIVAGLPVERWGERRSLAAYLGLGAHIGVRGPQSRDGKLVNHVRALPPQAGATAAGPAAEREHNQSDEMGWHTDAQADVLGLLCIRQAASGGESGWASATEVHNELLRRGRADLVAALAGRGWCRDRTRYQSVPPGAAPVWDMPVFSYAGGRLTAHFNAAHYRLCAAKYPGVAPLTSKQVKAMETFEAIASEPAMQLTYRLAPGEAAWLNNATVMHRRAAFSDDADAPGGGRHLVRLWLGVPEAAAGAPGHLAFPRSYSGGAYDCDTFDGLMRPDPAAFHVPLSCNADAE